MKSVRQKAGKGGKKDHGAHRAALIRAEQRDRRRKDQNNSDTTGVVRENELSKEEKPCCL